MEIIIFAECMLMILLSMEIKIVKYIHKEINKNFKEKLVAFESGFIKVT
jgi:hypothetical protein